MLTIPQPREAKTVGDEQHERSHQHADVQDDAERLIGQPFHDIHRAQPPHP